jgi:hypothetical protein
MFFLFETKPYIAVIGDIIESKKLPDRYEAQRKLKHVLEDVNAQYSEYIESRFMITLGDEFQGLLKNGEKATRIIEYIQIKMYPVEIRFGVGIGKIDTEINPLMPFGADGSAYHNARRMINTLKSSQKRNKSSDADIMIASDGNYSDLELLVNTILSLCTVIKQKWTERQREIAYDCILHGDNQNEAAARMNTIQPNIQKALSKADYYSYKNAMDVVSRVLADIRVKENV